MDRIFGGWRINGIYTYQTGAPLVFMNGSTNNPGDYALCSAPTAKGTRNDPNFNGKLLAGLCMDENGNLLMPAGFLPSDLAFNARRVVGTAFDTSHFVTGTTPSPNAPRLPANVLLNSQQTGQFQFHLRTLPTTFSSLRQDGQNNFDASIIKRFSVAEQAYLQFRFEAFNVLNHPTFGAPNLQVTSANFGVINTQANRPRQLQLGVRFVF
jgi:hypothetical protein